MFRSTLVHFILFCAKIYNELKEKNGATFSPIANTIETRGQKHFTKTSVKTLQSYEPIKFVDFSS